MTLNKLARNNVVRDKWTYFAYFISSAFSVFVFFSFSVTMFHPDLKVIQSGAALWLCMLTGEVLVYLFSFLFISYSIRSFMKTRSKTFGLLMIIGASKKQLNAIIFKENMIIGLAAIVTAIIVGLVVSPMFLLAAKKIMHLEGFAMYVPIKATILTFILFFILFLLVSYMSPKLIRKKKVIQMLDSDKTDEMELSFSWIQTLLGVIMLGAIVLASLLYDKLGHFKAFITGIPGTLALFGASLLGVYLLYKQFSVLFIQVFRSSRLYKRKTNMLVISDLKAKMRSNVIVMYLMTVLFAGAFFAITLLYSANADVESNIKADFPYSYVYISVDHNPYEQEHIRMIADTLGSEKGFREYRFTLLYGNEDKSMALMSESDYNRAVKGINAPEISLNNNQAYAVRNVENSSQNYTVSPEISELFKTKGLAIKMLGTSDRIITPSGFVQTIYVVPDNLMEEAKERFQHFYRLYAYNVDQWKEDVTTVKTLKTLIKAKDERTFQFSLISAGHMYEVEKTSKNLMLYVGSFLSTMFLIAASSMVYFRLITEKASECAKFRGIVKLGLSKKELSAVISRQLGTLMFVPFAVAMMIANLSIASIMNDFRGSYLVVAACCSLAFLVIQVIGYLAVRSKYIKVVFKEVYDGKG